MANNKKESVNWSYAILISLVSGIVSFIVFLFLEVIFGDILKEILSEQYSLGLYVDVNIILLVGLLFVFGTSIFLNLFIFKDFTFKSKVIANIFSLIATFIILFFISWIAIVIVFSETYSELDFYGELRLSVYFFAIFSIYILPNPVWFWILTFAVYHCVLIIFIKYFFIKKKRNHANKKSRSKKEVDINKYNMM